MGSNIQHQIKNLDDFLKNSKKDIEKKINDTILDKKILSLLNNGKRLRPLVEILSFKTSTMGKEPSNLYQKALEGTVCIELAHNASLIFDDIIDNDKKRRGKTAFYIKEGLPNALLTGQKMLAIGLDIVQSHGEKIVKLYISTWKESLEGELIEVDLNNKDKNNIKVEKSRKIKVYKEYEKIINMKTASLFASASRAGAIEANASDELVEILTKFGREIGFGYQLADDLVDLENGEITNSVINPLLNRLGNKTVDENSMKIKSVKKIIEKNSEKIKEIYIKEIKKHLEKAEELSKSKIIPQSPYKKLLGKMPSHIIHNMLRETNIIL